MWPLKPKLKLGATHVEAISILSELFRIQQFSLGKLKDFPNKDLADLFVMQRLQPEFKQRFTDTQMETVKEAVHHLNQAWLTLLTL